ncbi:unnamed protein product [Rhizoctonia solani]|uniref:Uncharacterized protein n=1 Tax=Rhizoctonia solani TaxID=456999 RepID=A0A8H2WMP3_9AGAM|nr:unnamed protein product [Rhizoctonia solani]
MPPKPTKRAKKLSTPVSNSEIEDAPVVNGNLPSTINSSRGFLALPNELISQIISYFPEIKTAHILMNPTFIGNWENPENYFERFNVLRALSQLCRLSRIIYLPLLWERFQVCLATDPDGQWFRSIGLAIERKSKGMLESPHLWPYVRVVTVSLSRFQTSKVLPPFVALLGVLPNVHTLEVPHAHSQITKALKAAFGGNVFSSIQKIILPTCAHEILRCCPEVREVTCNEDDGGRLVSALVHHGCRKLEVLRGVCAGPTLMKRMLTFNSDSTNRAQIMGIIGLSVASPPLRCVGIPERAIAEADGYVKLAKDTLRACAEYKPKKKGRKHRRKPTDEDFSDSEPADLYSEPRMVCIRIFIQRTYRPSPSEFSPMKIEQFPVEEPN